MTRLPKIIFPTMVMPGKKGTMAALVIPRPSTPHEEGSHRETGA